MSDKTFTLISHDETGKSKERTISMNGSGRLRKIYEGTLGESKECYKRPFIKRMMKKSNGCVLTLNFNTRICRQLGKRGREVKTNHEIMDSLLEEAYKSGAGQDSSYMKLLNLLMGMELRIKMLEMKPDPIAIPFASIPLQKGYPQNDAAAIAEEIERITST
jgi:hypothetical protein